jgi:hypothetical protein
MCPLPASASPESQTRTAIARRLAAHCPPHLGEEVLLVGTYRMQANAQAGRAGR